MKYILSNEAENDLENIWFYTFQTWSIRQADSYLNIIVSQIQHIANNPKVGKDYGKIRKGYFRSKIKSHYIFYKIDKRNKVVKVVRILHERMDIETRINE